MTMLPFSIAMAPWYQQVEFRSACRGTRSKVVGAEQGHSYEAWTLGSYCLALNLGLFSNIRGNSTFLFELL